MCGLMWVFCEWTNKIKALKVVPQQYDTKKVKFYATVCYIMNWMLINMLVGQKIQVNPIQLAWWINEVYF